jgi:hypothetical protein
MTFILFKRNPVFFYKKERKFRFTKINFNFILIKSDNEDFGDFVMVAEKKP